MPIYEYVDEARQASESNQSDLDYMNGRSESFDSRFQEVQMNSLSPEEILAVVRCSDLDAADHVANPKHERLEKLRNYGRAMTRIFIKMLTLVKARPSGSFQAKSQCVRICHLQTFMVG